MREGGRESRWEGYRREKGRLGALGKVSLNQNGTNVDRFEIVHLCVTLKWRGLFLVAIVEKTPFPASLLRDFHSPIIALLSTGSLENGRPLLVFRIGYPKMKLRK